MKEESKPQVSIYLDYNATAPPHPSVVEVMLRALREDWGNPSSAHPPGLRARELIAEAREKVSALVDCSPSEVIFTSGATEANRLALWSAWWGRKEGRRKVVVSAIEHSSVLEAAKSLSAFGAEVCVCPVNRQGIVKVDRLEELCDQETALVAVMAANNEIGTIQPIQSVAEIAERSGALFLCDAVQAIGKIFFSFRRCGCHYASVSAHKIYGPKGVGALIVRKGTPIRPILKASDQEGGFRPGTENVPGIVGFGEASAIAREELEKYRKVERLREALEEALRRCGACVVARESPRLPNTTGILFAGIEGRALAVRLARRGVFLATGSACHSQRFEPSHVLKAMGISPKRALGFIRISLGTPTTREEIEKACEIISEEVDFLKRRSQKGS